MAAGIYTSQRYPHRQTRQPASRYFTINRIDHDPLDDYAARKGMSVDEAERWLAPNLNEQR